LYKENEKPPGRWLKELPVAVWGQRTQPSRNTGISPYFMVFGSEAVLPADIAFRSPRVENHDEERSSEARELEVNCTEEHRLDTYARTAKYLEALRRYYNRNVKDRFFVVGDLVLRRKQKAEELHKLASHWEGLIWSSRSPDLLLIGCVISTESTSRIRGISITLGISTPNPLLKKDMYSFLYPKHSINISFCFYGHLLSASQIFVWWFTDQFFLLLEFPRASVVSDFSPRVHEIHSLRSGWSVVIACYGRRSYACLGSVPHALDYRLGTGWSNSRTK
jgi:hypothetical protein